MVEVVKEPQSALNSRHTHSLIHPTDDKFTEQLLSVLSWALFSVFRTHSDPHVHLPAGLLSWVFHRHLALSKAVTEPMT